MNVRKKLVSSSKYNIKCPYSMTPKFIVVHNTANDASAENEISYMISNNNEVSFHYAVDDKEVVQGIPTNRNAWHAGDGGNGQGNRYGIAIEICYSKSGGSRFTKSEQNAAKFIAQLLKEHGWGIDKVKKHQDFANKYCPHRTLDMGWDRFLDMIRKELGENVKPSNPSSSDKKYKIVKSIKGYYTAADAKARKNARTTVKAGTYYIFNESDGMKNVTSQKGKPGSWINPADNKTSSTSKKPDQVLSVGSVVTSVAMEVAIPKGEKTAVKTVNGDECIYVPALGGYFPTRFLSEYDASDGKKDDYFANTKTKVYVNKTTVQKVNAKDNLVKIHGVWVKPGPLTEIKEGK